jgi:zinc transporter ZupT
MAVAKAGRRKFDKMTVARKLGILVFCGVPAIVGGGIVYAIFNSLMAIAIYELLLFFAAGAFVAR